MPPCDLPIPAHDSFHDGDGTEPRPAARASPWKRPAASVLARAVRDVADLACPSSCVGCDAWGPPWCAACEASLTGVTRVVVPRSAPHLRVHAAEVFEGPLRRAVTQFKDEGRREARHSLAVLARRSVAAAVEDVLAASCIDTEPPEAVVLAPVPSSRTASRRRGRFPLGEVAAEVRRGTPLLDGTGLLRHRGRGRDQAGLDLAARRRNVAGAFVVPARSDGRRPAGSAWREGLVVLFDDVVTSGATLGAAHAALTRAGASRVVCAAIAATPAR